jgi:gluconate 2-dehydrogenase gamma chain
VSEKLSALGSRLSADEISRRDALKSFSLVAMAASLEVSLPGLERAVNGVASLAESREPRAESQQQAYVPKFFTRSEWQTVRVLVDYIIPKDAKSGSATDAKVPEFMDFLLADKDASVTTQTALRGGLGWLNRESTDRFAKTFVASSDAQRREILDDIAWPAKARPEMSQGVSFFNRMRDFTASGFFSSQTGWKDLDYIGGATNPNWDGCPPAALAKLGVSYDLMKKAGQ